MSKTLFEEMNVKEMDSALALIQKVLQKEIRSKQKKDLLASKEKMIYTMIGEYRQEKPVK